MKSSFFESKVLFSRKMSWYPYGSSTIYGVESIILYNNSKDDLSMSGDP